MRIGAHNSTKRWSPVDAAALSKSLWRMIASLLRTSREKTRSSLLPDARCKRCWWVPPQADVSEGFMAQLGHLVAFSNNL